MKRMDVNYTIMEYIIIYIHISNNRTLISIWWLIITVNHKWHISTKRLNKHVSYVITINIWTLTSPHNHIRHQTWLMSDDSVKSGLKNHRRVEESTETEEFLQNSSALLYTLRIPQEFFKSCPIPAVYHGNSSGIPKSCSIPAVYPKNSSRIPKNHPRNHILLQSCQIYHNPVIYPG